MKKKENKIPKTVTISETDLLKLEKLKEKEQPASSMHSYLSYVLKKYANGI